MESKEFLAIGDFAIESFVDMEFVYVRLFDDRLVAWNWDGDDDKSGNRNTESKRRLIPHFYYHDIDDFMKNRNPNDIYCVPVGFARTFCGPVTILDPKETLEYINYRNQISMDRGPDGFSGKQC